MCVNVPSSTVIRVRGQGSTHHHSACDSAVSRKIEQELNVKETKPPIVNQQRVVYGFQCDLCDVGYIGSTRIHLPGAHHNCIIA